MYGSWYCSQAPWAKYSDASFWKPYVETGGGEVRSAPSGVGKDRRGLEHHRAREHHDPLQVPGAVRLDRRLERGGQDPLVLGQQVERELVEVADAADHRGRGHHLIRIGSELGHERAVLGIALDESIPRVVVVALGHPPVLAEVVEPHDLVAGGQQLLDEVATDEPGSAGDEHLHESRSSEA